jgi:hypothetical protein
MPLRGRILEHSLLGIDIRRISILLLPVLMFKFFFYVTNLYFPIFCHLLYEYCSTCSQSPQTPLINYLYSLLYLYMSYNFTSRTMS